MKNLLLISFLLISVSAFSQKKEKEKPAKPLYDTTTIVINKLQIQRINDIDARRQAVLQQLQNEEALVLRVILESNNINPAHINADTLSMAFGEGKIFILRKTKKD